MNFLTIFLFSLIFLVTRNHSQSITLPDIYSSKSIKNFVTLMQQKFNNYNPVVKLSLSFNNADQYSEIYTDMTNLLFESQTISKKSFTEYLDILFKNDILKDPPLQLINQLRRRFEVDDNFIKYIVNSHGLFNSLVDLCTFASNCWRFLLPTLHEDNLNKLFFNLTKFIADKLKENHEGNDLCNKKISLQRNLYLFTELLMQKHIQEYILFTYALVLTNKCYQQGNTSEREIRNIFNLIGNKFITNLQQYNQPISAILSDLPQYIYECDNDRKEHIRDKTYFELEKMWQAFIAVEGDLNIYQSCKYNCEFPKEVLTDYNAECDDISECKYYHQVMYSCASHYDTPRRLEWFQDPYNKVIYGSDNTSCPGKIKTYHSESAFLRKCDYCVCLCKGKNSKRQNNVTALISFRNQVSNINENMVVVGIRFIKKNYMIHVQIKEGKLLPEGKIDVSTLKWKALENIEYNNAKNQPQITFDNGTASLLTKGVDYGYPYLMDLDDLVAPDNFVVTGVRFQYIRHTYIEKLEHFSVQLQVQITPFNYLQGTLVDTKKTHWISASDDLVNSVEPVKYAVREELVLKNPDNPIKSWRNVPNSGPNQFIKFRASDLKKDAGQSTVPFFDAQPVEGEPAFPLSGVGVFHKGAQGFGGFLSFRLYDLNLANYINPGKKDQVNQFRSKRAIPKIE